MCRIERTWELGNLRKVVEVLRPDYRDKSEISCPSSQLSMVGDMKKTILFAVVAFTLVGCSEKSDEEKAVEAIQEIVGDAFGSMPTVNTVSKEVARTWPEKFCSLKVNMSRQEVQAVMGEPTQIFSDSSFNQDQYEAWDYGLTIFYDIDDLARQLQSNYENIPCESTRFRD
jgi:hypothetical protein